jgi:hypothetical protein
MRPLLIGPEQVAELARVRAHAEAHRIGHVEVIASIAEGRPIAWEPGFRCVLPFGFRVAFSIEEHPGGWHRHLSVSVAAAPGRLPGMHAMIEIGRPLGMRMDIFDPSTHTYFWTPEPAIPHEVSVLELIDPPSPIEEVEAEDLEKTDG